MSKRFEERVHLHKKDERVANKHINGDSTWIIPNHEGPSDKPELRGIVQTNLPIIS